MNYLSGIGQEGAVAALPLNREDRSPALNLAIRRGLAALFDTWPARFTGA